MAGVNGMAGTNVHRASRPEEMIAKLCEVDMLVVQGLTIMEALRTIGVRLATYRHWREELDGLRHDETKRLKVLEAENAELRRVAADLTQRTAALRDAIRRGDRTADDRVRIGGLPRRRSCRLHRRTLSQE
jgi:hypothetical protein